MTAVRRLAAILAADVAGPGRAKGISNLPDASGIVRNEEVVRHLSCRSRRKSRREAAAVKVRGLAIIVVVQPNAHRRSRREGSRVGVVPLLGQP